MSATEKEVKEFDESQEEFTREQGEAPPDPDVVDYKMPYVLRLLDPITLVEGKPPIEELTFRNYLTSGMLAHFPADADQWLIGHYLPAISKMTGELRITIDKISPPDLTNCIAVVSHFFAHGRKTGKRA